MDRPDNHPSAGINVGNGKLRGLYKDHGSGAGKALSFFNFAVRYASGQFPDFYSSLSFYAEKVGLALPKKHPDLQPVPFLSSLLSSYFKNKPGISLEAIRRLNGQLAYYPGWSSDCCRVLYFSTYNSGGQEVGKVFVNADGGPIYFYKKDKRGKKETTTKKILFVKNSAAGLLNQHAISILSNPESKVDVLWKCEGLTDALAIQTAIPSSLQDSHLVITSMGGSLQWPMDSWECLFKGRNVFVIHDADDAGRQGAATWCNWLLSRAALVKNISLPFLQPQKDGKDVRDYLIHHSYQDLLDLAEKTATSQGTSRSGPADWLLRNLQLEVLGQYSDGAVEVFSGKLQREFRITDLSRFRYVHLVQYGSDRTVDLVTDSKDPIPNKINFKQIQEWIAHESQCRLLTEKTKLGIGCWRVSNSTNIVLISPPHNLLFNGQLSQLSQPRLEDQVFDFSIPVSWCDYDILKSGLFINPAIVMGKMRDLFDLWEWRYSWASHLLAALVCCTWVQTLWDWRPLVAITGRSDAGKSTFLEMCLRTIFGKLAVYVQKPSAAGIRQEVKNNATILLVDELEAGFERKKVMELFRTSSRGGDTLRGTSGQKAVRFGLKHIVWISAIESGLKREPDRNRFIMLEMMRQPAGRRGILPLPSVSDLLQIGMESLAISLRYIEQASRIAMNIKSVQVENVNGRTVETYAIPVAMMAILLDQSETWAKEQLTIITRQVTEDAPIFFDEHILLEMILVSHFAVGSGQQITPQEVINDYNLQIKYRSELERNGITLTNNHVGPRSLYFDFVFIQPDIVQRYLLGKTQWGLEDVDIRQILLRLDGARSVQRVIGGRRQYGVELPKELCNFVAQKDEATEDFLAS